VNLLNPEIIVIGRGVARAGTFQKTYEPAGDRRAFALPAKRVENHPRRMWLRCGPAGRARLGLTKERVRTSDHSRFIGHSKTKMKNASQSVVLPGFCGDKSGSRYNRPGKDPAPGCQSSPGLNRLSSSLHSNSQFSKVFWRPISVRIRASFGKPLRQGIFVGNGEDERDHSAFWSLKKLRMLMVITTDEIEVVVGRLPS